MIDKEFFMACEGVGVVNDVSVTKREERGTMRPKSRAHDIGEIRDGLDVADGCIFHGG